MFEAPSTISPYHIFLLRHAQSVGNAQGVYQGQTEYPLTEMGIRQSQALAERWRRDGQRFNQIISSPLARAAQTAEIIAGALNAPLEIEPEWMERNNGLLAGQRPDQVIDKYPRPAFIHPYQPIGETGESQWELYLRAGRAVQRLLRHPPGRYLVVSHGGILNLAMYAILGIMPHANFHGPRFRFRNASFATLVYYPDRNSWQLEGLNDRAHWTARDEH
jgi:2,3-bisphosphoglycerate-dependent phosphoglycerate mutase